MPTDNAVESCANCGELDSDAVDLKNCAACHLVKYCSVGCQKTHRKQHKKACKLREAELNNERLYTHGRERLEGDFCPLCTLPIPLPVDRHSVFNVCCMKKICNGCDMAAHKKGMSDCPFCRTPLPENADESLAMIQMRVDKKDPDALYFLGKQYFHGALGLQMDMRKAVELYGVAAELGSTAALYCLANVYFFGEGVQENKAKGLQCWAKAAMQGHVECRFNLGCYEIDEEGNSERAAKHFLISAKMGDVRSVEEIKDMFMGGVATKEQYTEALRGYQDAVEEMKSRDRDEAKAFLESERVVPVKKSKKKKEGRKKKKK